MWDQEEVNGKGEERIQALLSVLASLDSIEELQGFMSDLCTPAELRAMADRWCVVKLLASGLSYRQIHECTGVSTATITRVARAMVYGAGGYQRALSRGGVE